MYTDEKFMSVHYYFDADLNSDVMSCASRSEIPMEDDTVKAVLDDVHEVLRMARKSHSECC